MSKHAIHARAPTAVGAANRPGTTSARAVLAGLADGVPVSGAALARALGVTRTAVWKHIEALRARGLPIAAGKHTGYVLPWPLELLDAARIRAALSAPERAQLGGLDVLWEPQSTSTELRQRAVRDLSVVLAESQLGGRGRRGRGWLSPPGLNVHLSCLKRFDAGFAALSGLSLAVGVMVMRALTDAGIAAVGLKWPNDVLGGSSSAAPDAKLAGILIDLDGEYGGPCTAVIGIGINLRLPSALREQAGQAVTDLAELNDGTPPRRNQLVARLIARLLQGLMQFERDGLAAFAEDYARHDLLRDRRIHVHDAHHDFAGIASGIDARGMLRVRTGHGVVAVDSGDVSVRPA